MEQTKNAPIPIYGDELKRDNKNYKEIEDFEQYELTSCITYEMAIRNITVDEKLKKLEILVKFQEEHKYLVLEDDDAFFGVSEDRWHELLELLSLKVGMLSIELEKMIDKNKSQAFDNEKYQEILGENTRYSYNEMIQKIYKDKKFWTTRNTTKISISDLDNLQSFLEKDLIYNHYIYPKSATFQIQGSNESYDYDDEEHSLINFMNLANIDEHNGGFFYKIQNDSTTSLKLRATSENYNNENLYPKSEEPVKFEINTIIQTFKRRMYEPRTSLVALNFSKSLGENIAYLKAIYNYFDNSDKKIIQTPLEYLGEELKIGTIDYKNMSASEWADCFFIYDYYNLPHIDSNSLIWDRLKEIFNDYHGVKIEKSLEEKRKDKNKGDNSKYKVVEFKTIILGKVKYKPFYSNTTLRDRYKLIRTLIEDEKYKILLLR